VWNRTDVEFEFADASRGETVPVEALLDGESVGRAEIDARGLVHFTVEAGFDELTLTAGKGGLLQPGRRLG
jgi:hypothetical protein